MKIYVTTKFINIGFIIIVIIIMIDSYTFKITEAGNNEPFLVTPSTCGYYRYFVSGGPAWLSLKQCWFLLFLFPYVSVCQAFKY